MNGASSLTSNSMPTCYAHEMARIGGKWLATARTWLQSHVMNGDRVTWGSGEELRMTVAQFEDAAAFIAAAAVNDERARVAREARRE